MMEHYHHGLVLPLAGGCLLLALTLALLIKAQRWKHQNTSVKVIRILKSPQKLKWSFWIR